MARDISLLDRVRIASPCTASWAEMEGDERVRFCGQCRLHVYNIAEMTREAAETLIQETEGRLCARIYRRHDGTVLTRDCPIGWRRLRRVAGTLVGAAAAMVGVLLMISSSVGVTSSEEWWCRSISALRDREPFARFYYWMHPVSIPMGGMLIRNPGIPPKQFLAAPPSNGE